MTPVLFTTRNSVYKSLPGTDCFDIDRDAKTYDKSYAVVAHPPCRAWGKLAQFANPRPGERELAVWAVDLIRKNGGVLEHPSGSRLWPEKGLPAPGCFDEFGGFTYPVNQQCFGHRAQKATLLYICGCRPAELPVLPLALGEASHVVSTSKARHRPLKPEIKKSEREATPLEFAEFLLNVARLIEENKREEVAA